MDKVTQSWVDKANKDRDKYNNYIDKIKSLLEESKLGDISVGNIREREADIEVIDERIFDLKSKLEDVYNSYTEMLEFRVMHELGSANE